jgi:hypothetical protein
VAATQRRGILLLEEAGRAMQILGEDPPLNNFIGNLRITPADTNEEEELNNSKTIPPEESADQENTSPMSPHVGSPVTTTSQKVSKSIEWDWYA